MNWHNDLKMFMSFIEELPVQNLFFMQLAENVP